MNKQDLNKWGLRRAAEIGRILNYNQSADNLDHYLDNTGEAKTLSREEARNKLHILNAEKINQKRFIEGFLDRKFDKEGQPRPGRQILNLKNGQKIPHAISDYWDYLIKTENKDEHYATGTTTLKSKGDFDAKRINNTIYIDGIVNHYWWDDYDFDKKKLSFAYELAEAKKAKPFREHAGWRQRLTGTVELKDKKLVRPHFTWQDIDYIIKDKPMLFFSPPLLTACFLTGLAGAFMYYKKKKSSWLGLAIGFSVALIVYSCIFYTFIYFLPKPD